MANTDAPTVVNRDCDHPRTVHYHGTLVCYMDDACRCGDCIAAHTAYHRSWRQKTIAGPLGVYWEPGSPEWLAAMRKGLRQAVRDSIERHGRVG